MGNHAAGKAMGKTAELMLAHRGDQSAVALLDAICEPWRNCDAEFEAGDPSNPGRIHPDYTFYTDPQGPLGMLIKEVWGEEGVTYMEHVDGAPRPVPSEDWWEGPRQNFKDHYEFW